MSPKHSLYSKAKKTLITISVAALLFGIPQLFEVARRIVAFTQESIDNCAGGLW